MSEFFNLENLQIIWFVIWGLLWAVYFILDGFDLGIGTLLPFIAKSETEKRMMFNAVGPFWDGNEVWLITAGGVTFAAFPVAYAVMFSALYAPLLILLFGLILRAVSFEFRNKIDSPQWRSLWDAFQFLGNAVPALLLGVAFANLFMGIPINERGVYMGNLLTLLNPYGLAGGVFFVAMFCLHGTLWLAIRTSGELHERALGLAARAWVVVLGLALVFLFATSHYTNLYANYMAHPALWIFPVLAVVMLVGLRFFLAGRMLWLSFAASSLFILCITFFGVFGMFPGIIISSIDPAYSVTAINGSSTVMTLRIMLAVSLLCVPVVIAYQAWVYSMFSYKLTEKDLASDHTY